MMRRRALLLVVAGAMAGLFLGAGADTATRRHGAPAATPVYVQWLRVDAQHPRTLFIGGTTTCARSTLDRYCPILFMRSTDGGVTWADLSRALGIAYTPGACAVPTLPSPVQIAAHGRHLYLAVKHEGISPNCSSAGHTMRVSLPTGATSPATKGAAGAWRRARAICTALARSSSWSTFSATAQHTALSAMASIASMAVGAPRPGYA